MFSLFQKKVPKEKSSGNVAATLATTPYRVVKITINGNQSYATNLTNCVVFPIMDTTVTIEPNDGKESSSIKLRKINHDTIRFFEPVTANCSVEFFFANTNITTKLSPEMSFNLINFFKLYKPKTKSNYCCINFAYELAYGRGKIANDNDTSNFKELSSREFSEEKLIPGDVVHLYNASNTNHHYAISIGQKSYLSLFGVKGPLMVTSLDAVKKGFAADTCVKAIKKRL